MNFTLDSRSFRSATVRDLNLDETDAILEPIFLLTGDRIEGSTSPIVTARAFVVADDALSGLRKLEALGGGSQTAVIRDRIASAIPLMVSLDVVSLDGEDAFPDKREVREVTVVFSILTYLIPHGSDPSILPAPSFPITSIHGFSNTRVTPTPSRRARRQQFPISLGLTFEAVEPLLSMSKNPSSRRLGRADPARASDSSGAYSAKKGRKKSIWFFARTGVPGPCVL